MSDLVMLCRQVGLFSLVRRGLVVKAIAHYSDDGVTPSAKQRANSGHPFPLTDAELVCIAIAQVLLRCDDERHWFCLSQHRISQLCGHRSASSGTYV